MTASRMASGRNSARSLGARPNTRASISQNACVLQLPDELARWAVDLATATGMNGAMTGTQYRKLIARYLARTYAERGVRVYEEVNLGTSIIGKQRRVDLLVLGPEAAALAVECKFQDSSGTVDEKIPYALQDLEAQRMPGVVCYAGIGFSEGVLHLLQSSEHAAYCLPDPDVLLPVSRRAGARIDSGTWQLDHILAITFRWWDILIADKTPVSSL